MRDARFIVIDIVDWFVLTCVFRESVCLQTVYLWMNVAQVREILAKMARDGRNRHRENAAENHQALRQE
jgi:hypothetical protein